MLRRGANRPLDTNQTPTEACENTCVTRLEATAISSSPTQVEKTDAKIDAQQMPKFTVAKQYDYVSICYYDYDSMKLLHKFTSALLLS